MIDPDPSNVDERENAEFYVASKNSSEFKPKSTDEFAED